MKKVVKIFYKTLFLILVIFSVNVHGKILSSGDVNAKVTVKVFSSLTCPACANFHSEIYYDLKKDFIDVGLVKFEHHPFPLDLAALNAEIILRCSTIGEKKFEQMHDEDNSSLFILTESEGKIIAERISVNH